MAVDRPVRHHRYPSKASPGVRANGTGASEAARSTNVAPDHAATVAYIKRILCARSIADGTTNDSPGDDDSTKPLDELLPPLTSSNEIDLELYALIAAILSHFVQVWYSRITPDADFVDEIVRIIAHCTRALESRLRLTDLESILLDEVPALLDSHLKEAAEIARQTAQRGWSLDSKEERVSTLFHALCPHPALSPAPVNDQSIAEERENEVAWAQMLIDKVVPLTLPPEDLANPCLHLLVSGVLSQVIFYGALLGKLSEPWLIWEGLTKIVRLLRPDTVAGPTTSSPQSGSRLEQFGLLHGTDEEDANGTSHHRRNERLSAITVAFWTFAQYVALSWAVLRSMVASLSQASSLSPRLKKSKRLIVSASALGKDEDQANKLERLNLTIQQSSIIESQCWTLMVNILQLDKRMPWLLGVLSLLQWFALLGPGKLCGFDSTVDRLLSAQVHQKLLNPALLPPMLRAIRAVMFPNDVMAAGRIPPSSDEVIVIRRECALSIVAAVPDAVRARYFGTRDLESMVKDVETTLDLFDNQYVNKHLVVSIIEHLVVRLFPELEEGGVGDGIEP